MNRAPFHALTLLALAAGCADPAPDPTPPDDVPMESATPADAPPDAVTDDAPDAADASSPDATTNDASSDAAPDAAPDVAADSAPDVTADGASDAMSDVAPDVANDAPTTDAAPDVASDAPTADAARDATLDASLDAALDASSDAALDASSDAPLDVALDARPDVAPDVATDAAPDVAPDVATDAPAGDGGVAGGFSTTAAGWVVPPNGLSDGFYATALANGTRWWTLVDMNGDGRPDLVQTGDPARTGGYVFGAGTATPTWRVFLNTGTGFSTAAVAWTLPDIGLSDGPYVADIANGTRWWSTFDIDGDRRPDLVQTGDPTRTGGYVFGAGTATPTWRVFRNTGTGFATTAVAWTLPNIGLSDGPYTANIANGSRWWSTMDMDGDGRPDLVQTGDPARTGGYVFGAGTATPTWRVFRNTGTGFAATATAWALPNIGLSDGPYTANIAEGVRWWSTMDLDGDGRPDFVQTGDPARTGGYVFGAGTATPTWRVYVNSGAGFATTATAWALPNVGLSDGPYTANIANGTRWWSTLDMDGDRRPELVQTGDPARTGGYVFGAGTATPTWRVFANTGAGFATAASSWALPDVGLSDGPYTASIANGTRWWATLDLNGDRRADLVQTGDPTRTGGYVFGAGTAVNTWRVFVGR
ncbi:MAG: VCBS repeat-containing protein [Polyangiales bacterium]